MARGARGRRRVRRRRAPTRALPRGGPAPPLRRGAPRGARGRSRPSQPALRRRAAGMTARSRRSGVGGAVTGIGAAPASHPRVGAESGARALARERGPREEWRRRCARAVPPAGRCAGGARACAARSAQRTGARRGAASSLRAAARATDAGDAWRPCARTRAVSPLVAVRALVDGGDLMHPAPPVGVLDAHDRLGRPVEVIGDEGHLLDHAIDGVATDPPGTTP